MMKLFTVSFLAGLAAAHSLWDGDYKCPKGVKTPDSDVGPHSAPPEGCTNVFHPPHTDVYIDNCDDHSQTGWHWVHPETTSHKPHNHHVWSTSTLTTTDTKTIYQCPPSITACPEHQKTHPVTTVTVDVTTTICPVLAASSAAPVYSSSYALPASTTAASAAAMTSVSYATTAEEAEGEITTTVLESSETTICPEETEITAPVAAETTIPAAAETMAAAPTLTTIYSSTYPVGTGSPIAYTSVPSAQFTAGAALNAQCAGAALLAAAMAAAML
jgi:hypothetical protein